MWSHRLFVFVLWEQLYAFWFWIWCLFACITIFVSIVLPMYGLVDICAFFIIGFSFFCKFYPVCFFVLITWVFSGCSIKLSKMSLNIIYAYIQGITRLNIAINIMLQSMGAHRGGKGIWPPWKFLGIYILT